MTARSARSARSPHLAVGLALLAVAALPARAQEAATLSDLVARAQGGPAPAATLLRSLGDLQDGAVDAAEVAAAARTAPAGPLAELLAGVKSIRKAGGLVTIERDAPVEVELGTGQLRVAETARIAVDRGQVEGLRPVDRERLAANEGEFVRVRAISGLELDGSPLRALVTVEQQGEPVTHVARGASGTAEWSRVESAPAAQEEAQQAAAAVAPIAPQDGLADRIDQVADATGGDVEAQAAVEAVAQDPAAAEPAEDEATVAQDPAVVVPEPEEKARLDEATDAVTAEVDTLASEIEELKRGWSEDQDAARAGLEALIEELREDNVRLEAQLADLRRAREERAAPDPAGAPLGPPVADAPGLDLGRDRPDVARAEPLRREGADADGADAAAAGEGEAEDKKQSPLEQLLMALLEGITKGLSERLSSAAATNIETRGELVAVTAEPEHRPYIDARLGAGVRSSGLWRMPTSAARPRSLRILPGQPVPTLPGVTGPAAPAPAGPAPTAITAPPGLGGSPLTR